MSEQEQERSRAEEIASENHDEWHGGYVRVADLRGHPPIPELPEAAARNMIPFLAELPGPTPGTRKLVLQCAPPEVVDQFMKGKLVAKIKNVYGVPSRGYAGATIDE
jgi:hypothetical protein